MYFFEPKSTASAKNLQKRNHQRHPLLYISWAFRDKKFGKNCEPTLCPAFYCKRLGETYFSEHLGSPITVVFSSVRFFQKNIKHSQNIRLSFKYIEPYERRRLRPLPAYCFIIYFDLRGRVLSFYRLVR